MSNPETLKTRRQLNAERHDLRLVHREYREELARQEQEEQPDDGRAAKRDARGDVHRLRSRDQDVRRRGSVPRPRQRRP
jgi:hypothetical protein